jgi:predicted PurR-regulated permease PerM
MTDDRVLQKNPMYTEIVKKTLTICALVALFCAGLYAIFLSRNILLYLFIALIFAMAINPLVVRIERWKVRRIAAVTLAILIVVLFLLGIAATVITPLIQQGIALAHNLPDIVQSILNNPTFIALNDQYHFADGLSQLSSQASAILSGSASLLSIAGNVITILSGLFVIIVLSLLLLIEGSRLWRSALSFLREKDARTAERIGVQIMHAVSGFVSGNLFISLIAGIVTLITLWILQVPYLFALAALVALFDLIPLVGAAIATVAVGLVALSGGFLTAAIAVTVLLIYQFIEGHVIQPLVYSRSVHLSALLIVIASLLGAEIAGIIGILLAIPVAAMIQITINEFYTLFTKTNSHR